MFLQEHSVQRCKYRFVHAHSKHRCGSGLQGRRGDDCTIFGAADFIETFLTRQTLNHGAGQSEAPPTLSREREGASTLPAVGYPPLQKTQERGPAQWWYSRDQKPGLPTHRQHRQRCDPLPEANELQRSCRLHPRRQTRLSRTGFHPAPLPGSQLENSRQGTRSYRRNYRSRRTRRL
jgi:hypothetical protein